MKLRLHPDALVELGDAVTYLERERAGLGAALFAEITQRVAQASRWPRSGAPTAGFAAQHDVRQFALTRFRYLVITAVVRDERVVVAIAHTSREPGYWRERVG
jgi:plasmid stabilization system protein ParE